MSANVFFFCYTHVLVCLVSTVFAQYSEPFEAGEVHEKSTRIMSRGAVGWSNMDDARPAHYGVLSNIGKTTNKAICFHTVLTSHVYEMNTFNMSVDAVFPIMVFVRRVFVLVVHLRAWRLLVAYTTEIDVMIYSNRVYYNRSYNVCDSGNICSCSCVMGSSSTTSAQFEFISDSLCTVAYCNQFGNNACNSGQTIPTPIYSPTATVVTYSAMNQNQLPQRRNILTEFFMLYYPATN